MSKGAKQIDIPKLREILNSNPALKKAVQEALNTDRQTISKILNERRGLDAGELLTISEICGIEPMELAAG
jgi:plasmid maintenance system antidote protein VapI